jgi:hypothetical protein
VGIAELELTTMRPSPIIPVERDVRKLEIGEAPGGFAYHLTGDRLDGFFRRGAGDVLAPFSGPESRRGMRSLTRLTPTGATPTASVASRAGCGHAEEKVGADGIAVVTVSARGRPPRRLGETLGAGFAGLPLP